ncbi:hypothetical protein, partial [Pseudomonas aeruginosa]|uniref:hypothetical protein n=1 Tax=Pseudomonas aeruginosa TaxID=287 RepID=UPI0028855F50
AGYYAGPLDLPGLSGLPGASALRVAVRDRGVSLFAVAARLPGATYTDTFEPDGGRVFTPLEPEREAQVTAQRAARLGAAAGQREAARGG